MADEKVTLQEDLPQEVVSDFNKLKDYSKRVVRGKEQKLKSAGGSVSVRQNGNIMTAAGLYSQEKQNSVLQQTEKIGIKEHSTSNTKMIDTDDFMINQHKLNNKLYELADYKTVLQTDIAGSGGIAGKFMMFGMVLTKSWDHSLNKYVMIRRLAAIPMFSPQLSIGQALPGLKLMPSTEKANQYKEAFKSSGLDLNTFLSKNVNTITNGTAEKKSSTQTSEKTTNDNGAAESSSQATQKK